MDDKNVTVPNNSGHKLNVPRSVAQFRLAGSCEDGDKAEKSS